MDKRLLIIDGNYFAQRVLGQINMGDSVNNLETEQEQNSFTSALNNSLINLYKIFNNENSNLIDNVIFVSDSGSWRKDVEPIKPYWLDDDRVIGYKEQRKTKKEESPINYDNFYKLYDEFIESIKNVVTVCRIDKLEGDDNIMFLSHKLKELPNVFSIVFCTDGDLEQVVRDNVVLMRNIRSKEAPNGEFVINLNMYTKLFEQSASMESLLGSSLDNKYYKDLFSVMIGSIDGQNKVKRELNKGISIATPFKTALIKSVAGDKKDNLFSLISWKSSTGTRQYNITEKIIDKALAKHNYSLTENNCQKILTSKDAIYNLMLSLRETTKQPNAPIDEIIKHLKHNLKLNVLSPNNIPEIYRNEFDKFWEDNKNNILGGTVNEDKLFSLNGKFSNNQGVKSILDESIPDIINLD